MLNYLSHLLVSQQLLGLHLFFDLMIDVVLAKASLSLLDPKAFHYLLVEQYRHLCQFDPLAEMAAIKGKADGEREMAQILHKAAQEGDAKAALEILKHQHGWVAKQSISVDIDQRISITQALQEAELRVIEVVDAVHQIQR